jgi:hypothetical protein
MTGIEIEHPLNGSHLWYQKAKPHEISIIGIWCNGQWVRGKIGENLAQNLQAPFNLA